MKYLLEFLAAAIIILGLVSITHATVAVSASVPCNPINCPEPNLWVSNSDIPNKTNFLGYIISLIVN